MATVCIGANYGDEGKGAVVDYLVDRERAKLVVRFNGGAQAGHTVVTPCGKRHVFKHFGSGTFAGAKTFLSRHFVLNPMMYVKEKEALYQLGIENQKLLIDPRATISTPYDIIANQARERFLGNNRDGSCGLGIRDAVERNLIETYQLTIDDVLHDLTHDQGYLDSKLEFIRGEWLPNHLKSQNVPYTLELQKLALNDNVFERFLNDLRALAYSSSLVHAKDIGIHGPIIFEGAQGLGLDQINGHYPHVTRSFTGLTNVMEICQEANIGSLEVYYVTRSYLTRHGAGPMENELSENEKPYNGIVEVTNVTNEFQGRFRYGFLDPIALRQRIYQDLLNAENLSQLTEKIKIFPKLAITCLDQFDDVIPAEDFAYSLARSIGFPHYIQSFGHTRKTMKERLALYETSSL